MAKDIAMETREDSVDTNEHIINMSCKVGQTN